MSYYILTYYAAALPYANATLVNRVTTQERTGGIILGILVLNEIPSLAGIIGVLTPLAGILLVII